MGKEKSKKQMKPWVRAVLAVVAAACLAGAIIGIVFLVNAAINAITGYGGDRAIGEEREELPIKPVEDRLYFTFDGHNDDITNAVDRDLPYIYPYEDPETHMPAYIIAGGDRENYAYVNVVLTEDGGWHGQGRTLEDGLWLIDVYIDDNGIYNEPYAGGWYLLNEPDLPVLNYDRSLFDDYGLLETVSHAHFLYSIPEALEECGEAWLIRGLLELELIQVPDLDYSLLDPIEVTGEGRVIFKAEGQETDITDIINEGTPYIYRVKHADGFGGDYDSYILVGGPPVNCGWALLCRAKDDMWIGAKENISFINEALSEGDPGYETFRQWYLNGVEKIGYDTDVILKNRT